MSNAEYSSPPVSIFSAADNPHLPTAVTAKYLHNPFLPDDRGAMKSLNKGTHFYRFFLCWRKKEALFIDKNRIRFR